jgi:hypothetical protein
LLTAEFRKIKGEIVKQKPLMPHIQLPENAPGILGPMKFSPQTAAPMNALANALLQTDDGLSRGERELIATYVSFAK